MVTPRLRPYRKWELIGFFFIALFASLLIFNVTNTREHDRVRREAHAACLNDQQIAANQRRVILALIEIEQRERAHEGLLTQDGKALRLALANIPKFNCK